MIGVVPVMAGEQVVDLRKWPVVYGKTDVKHVTISEGDTLVVRARGMAGHYLVSFELPGNRKLSKRERELRLYEVLLPRGVEGRPQEFGQRVTHNEDARYLALAPGTETVEVWYRLGFVEKKNVAAFRLSVTIKKLEGKALAKRQLALEKARAAVRGLGADWRTNFKTLLLKARDPLPWIRGAAIATLRGIDDRVAVIRSAARWTIISKRTPLQPAALHVLRALTREKYVPVAKAYEGWDDWWHRAGAKFYGVSLRK